MNGDQSRADTVATNTAGADVRRITAELLLPIGVDGVYARTALYEDVVDRLQSLISRWREPGVEVLRFPPVMSRRQLELSGYLASFPHLLGTVSALDHAPAERHASGPAQANWTSDLTPTDLVLAPAACYPVYPLAASRGDIPQNGREYDVRCDCFRREPSREIDRLQSFRMREFVFIGAEQGVVAFREHWMARSRLLADELGLVGEIASASDPFFGRVGQMRAVSQRQQELKFEFLIPVRAAAPPTACMSFNYHREHFGKIWKLQIAGGEVCHTACIAFGIDRLAVALFARHGLDVLGWPATVRAALLF